MVNCLTAWQSGTLAPPLREGGSGGALSIPDHAIDAGDFAQPTPRAAAAFPFPIRS